MKRRALPIIIGFAVLVSITAALLLRVRSNYVLGKPGIKLVNVPIYNEDTNVVSEVSAFLPESIGDYSSTRIEPVTTVEQGMLPPDTVYGRRIYTAPDNFQALISIVVMGTDRTSIHKPQYCLTGQGQEIVGSEIIDIPILSPDAYNLKAMKLTTRSQRRKLDGTSTQLSGVFLYWFVADGHLTPHHGERMWLMGKELVTTGLLQRWAYVAYYANCLPGQEDALTERLKSFVAQSVPQFQVTSGASKVANSSASKRIAQN